MNANPICCCVQGKTAIFKYEESENSIVRKICTHECVRRSEGTCLCMAVCSLNVTKINGQVWGWKIVCTVRVNGNRPHDFLDACGAVRKNLSGWQIKVIEVSETLVFHNWMKDIPNFPLIEYIIFCNIVIIILFL